jgi:hypothetical protein
MAGVVHSSGEKKLDADLNAIGFASPERKTIAANANLDRITERRRLYYLDCHTRNNAHFH